MNNKFGNWGILYFIILIAIPYSSSHFIVVYSLNRSNISYQSQYDIQIQNISNFYYAFNSNQSDNLLLGIYCYNATFNSISKSYKGSVSEDTSTLFDNRSNLLDKSKYPILTNYSIYLICYIKDEDIRVFNICLTHSATAQKRCSVVLFNASSSRNTTNSSTLLRIQMTTIPSVNLTKRNRITNVKCRATEPSQAAESSEPHDDLNFNRVETSALGVGSVSPGSSIRKRDGNTEGMLSITCNPNPLGNDVPETRHESLCRNNGMCAPLPEFLGLLSGLPRELRYYCHCPLGYYGKFCEIKHELTEGRTCLPKVYLKPSVGNLNNESFRHFLLSQNFLGFNGCNKCICYEGKILCSQMWCGPTKCSMRARDKSKLATTVPLPCSPSDRSTCTKSQCFTHPCFDTYNGHCIKDGDIKSDGTAQESREEFINATDGVSIGEERAYFDMCDALDDGIDVRHRSTNCYIFRLRVETESLPKGLTIGMVCDQIRTHSALQDYTILWKLELNLTITLKIMCGLGGVGRDRDTVVVAMRALTERFDRSVPETFGIPYDLPGSFKSALLDRYNRPSGIIPYVRGCFVVMIIRYRTEGLEDGSRQSTAYPDSNTEATSSLSTTRSSTALSGSGTRIYTSLHSPISESLHPSTVSQRGPDKAVTVMFISVAVVILLIALCTLGTSVALVSKLSTPTPHHPKAEHFTIPDLSVPRPGSHDSGADDSTIFDDDLDVGEKSRFEGETPAVFAHDWGAGPKQRPGYQILVENLRKKYDYEKNLNGGSLKEPGPPDSSVGMSLGDLKNVGTLEPWKRYSPTLSKYSLHPPARSGMKYDGAHPNNKYNNREISTSHNCASKEPPTHVTNLSKISNDLSA